MQRKKKHRKLNIAQILGHRRLHRLDPEQLMTRRTILGGVYFS